MNTESESFRRFGSFQYSIPIDSHMISINEQDERFDLRVDNQPFSHLYLSEKSKSSFKYEGDGYDGLDKPIGTGYHT